MKTWRTTFKEDLVDRGVDIGTASGLWLQTGADGELLLPNVLSRTGGSKCLDTQGLKEDIRIGVLSEDAERQTEDNFLIFSNRIIDEWNRLLQLTSVNVF